MTDENKTQNTPALSVLTNRLEDLLTTPEYNPDTLTAQTEILHALFTEILTHRVATRINNSKYYTSPMEWMMLALRVQKQCADTAKAQSAIEYMKHLNTAPASPVPAPSLHDLSVPSMDHTHKACDDDKAPRPLPQIDEQNE